MIFDEGEVVRRFHRKGKEVIFRYPKRSDSTGMRKCINSLIKERAYVGEEKRVTEKVAAKRMDATLKSMKKGKEIMLCVEIGGKYAGSGRIYKKGLDAEKHVMELRVRLERPYRGLGIGTRLMLTLERLAKERMKAKVLELTCFSLNNPAMRLYRKLGYREVGRIPKGCYYYGKYCDDIIMAKVLK